MDSEERHLLRVLSCAWAFPGKHLALSEMTTAPCRGWTGVLGAVPWLWSGRAAGKHCWKLPGIGLSTLLLVLQGLSHIKDIVRAGDCSGRTGHTKRDCLAMKWGRVSAPTGAGLCLPVQAAGCQGMLPVSQWPIFYPGCPASSLLLRFTPSATSSTSFPSRPMADHRKANLGENSPWQILQWAPVPAQKVPAAVGQLLLWETAVFLPDSWDQPSSLKRVDTTRREIEICSKLPRDSGASFLQTLSSLTMSYSCWMSQASLGDLTPALRLGTSI